MPGGRKLAPTHLPCVFRTFWSWLNTHTGIRAVRHAACRQGLFGWGGSRSLSTVRRWLLVRFANVRADQNALQAEARYGTFPAWLLWFVITRGEGSMYRFLLSLGRLFGCTALSLVVSVTHWLLN